MDGAVRQDNSAMVRQFSHYIIEELGLNFSLLCLVLFINAVVILRIICLILLNI